MSAAAALVLGLVFFASAFTKARAPYQFREQVADFRILPYAVVPVLASLLPVIEAAAAVLVVIPSTRRLGATACASLLLIFLGFLISALKGNRRIDCGCFGGSGDLGKVGAHGLIRIGLLLAVSALAGFLQPDGFTSAGVLLSLLVVTAIFSAAELVRLFTEYWLTGADVAHDPTPVEGG